MIAAMGVIALDRLTEWAAVGELGLDGQIAPVAGAASAMGLGLICTHACGSQAA